MTGSLAAIRTLVAATLIAVLVVPATARADDRRVIGAPDPRRTVSVLEYRKGSAALPGVAARIVHALSRRTSLRVLDQDQTRASYGDQLDEVVVKCGGDPVCIAQIGERIGAAEVLLIGVSELGDVILTLQRIDVGSASVASRVADSLAPGVTPSEPELASYTSRLMPPSDFLRFGRIDIVASQAGAAVSVGGLSRGLTPIGQLVLEAPATYDIRIDKPGYLPFSTKVALPPDGEVKVEAELARRRGDAWYQQWYVLAAAGLIVAGAGGTAIYFGTRDSGPSGDRRVPISVTIH